MARIYADHAGTSPLLPAAKEAMMPWLEGGGNPSSVHHEGRQAKAALDAAREVVATSIGVEFADVIFTSGGTESANLAIIGAALANQSMKRKRVLVSAGEHHCVLGCIKTLERLGFVVELLPIDCEARLSLPALENALGDDVFLVAAMAANNEFGTIQPTDEISALCAQNGTLYFCDQVQVFPQKIDQIAMASASAHKIGGPMGIGALAVQPGVKIGPLIAGGGQERERRGGTENVAGAVGFAAAILNLQDDHRAMARNAFVGELQAQPIKGLTWTVEDSTHQLTGHAHLRIDGCSAESMLIVMDGLGLSASNGAACSSGAVEPSHVMLAAGFSEKEAGEALRFTFGRSDSADLGRRAAKIVSEAVRMVQNS